MVVWSSASRMSTDWMVAGAALALTTCSSYWTWNWLSVPGTGGATGASGEATTGVNTLATTILDGAAVLVVALLLSAASVLAPVVAPAPAALAAWVPADWAADVHPAVTAVAAAAVARVRERSPRRGEAGVRHLTSSGRLG